MTESLIEEFFSNEDHEKEELIKKSMKSFLRGDEILEFNTIQIFMRVGNTYNCKNIDACLPVVEILKELDFPIDNTYCRKLNCLTSVFLLYENTKKELDLELPLKDQIQVNLLKKVASEIIISTKNR